MKLGLSSCGKKPTEELFQQYKNASIDAMEISYGKEETDALDFAQLKVFADTYGVELWSLHLPFSPFRVLDLSREAGSETAVEYFKTLMKKANEQAGICRFVVHPSGEPIWKFNRKKRMKTAKKALNELAEFAAGFGAAVCVENLPRTCLGRNSDEIFSLLQANEKLRVCFDTNHLLGEDFAAFIEKVGDKIVTTHISDYDFVDERHWLPGEGKLDWQRLLTCLRSAGYDAMWLYELGFAIPKTLPSRTRELTCADFAENARKLGVALNPEE